VFSRSWIWSPCFLNLIILIMLITLLPDYWFVWTKNGVALNAGNNLFQIGSAWGESWVCHWRSLWAASVFWVTEPSNIKSSCNNTLVLKRTLSCQRSGHLGSRNTNVHALWGDPFLPITELSKIYYSDSTTHAAKATKAINARSRKSLIPTRAPNEAATSD